MKTVFLRVIEAVDKATALLAAIHEPAAAKHARQRFEVSSKSFADVPRSPFTYWVSNRLRGLFTELPSFGNTDRAARQGMATADDFRFVRAWWAVPQENAKATWVPFAKGGAFSPFYASLDLVVNWGLNGEELKAWAAPLYNNSGWSRIIKSTDYYFRPGLTWPLRTHRFCPQILPMGVAISVRGSGIYSEDPELFLGLFSSQLVDRLMRMLSGQDARPQFDMGDVAALPIPHLAIADRDRLALLARRGWSLKRLLEACVETSHAFALPALLGMRGETVDESAAAWVVRVCSSYTEQAAIQAEIDELSFRVYGIDEDDRRAINEGFGTRSANETTSESESDAEDETADSQSVSGATGLAAELVSWVVGVAFGRFDVRLASGARPLPTEPEPFDALPACSPGMLTGEDGLPLSQPPAGYPLAFPDSGILVDDPGHAQDLTASVRAVFEVAFAEGADRWWYDVAALLDPKNHDLRNWLAGSFFEHHLKRHSKSRRKAPILWQLGTPTGRYSVWLYTHRLTRDSFFQLQNEVVGPKLDHEERQLTSLIQNAGGSPSAAERKAIVAQEGVVEELRAMKAEVQRVTPLWNPNLDDGVVLTMAPLWRLVPQHKPWQKELKAKWQELAAGKYDWAHLAMHLWPERIVPKCATDRSLAIAHGLEEIFWIEGTDGKWQARATPTRPVDELVDERTSPAVKAALKSLLDAPSSSGAGAARGRRAASTSVIEEGNS